MLNPPLVKFPKWVLWLLFVLGFVGLLLLIYFLFFYKPELDFGDAPDGGFTGYDSGAQDAEFPAKLASNGARVNNIDKVWLGFDVDKEKESRQVDSEVSDDGVNLGAASCAKSTANFVVHVANPGGIQGKAYLNLFADWNKDGKWEGSDECGGREWAVQNFEINLAEQTSEFLVYNVEYIAGKNVENIWYRGTVTLEQKMNSELGTGEYNSGEVEDYGPSIKGDSPAAHCVPKKSFINHGGSATFRIIPLTNLNDFKEVLLTNSEDANTPERTITNNGDNTFTYTSKDIDGPERDVGEKIGVRARFGSGSIITECYVWVHHEEPPHAVFPDGIDTSYTKTERQLQGKTLASFLVRMRLIDPALANLIITGFEFIFGNQQTPLGDAHWGMINLNNKGFDQSDWQCEVIAGTALRCKGSQSLEFEADSFFDILYTVDFAPPDYLKVNLLNGDTVVREVQVPLEK